MVKSELKKVCEKFKKSQCGTVDYLIARMREYLTEHFDKLLHTKGASRVLRDEQVVHELKARELFLPESFEEARRVLNRYLVAKHGEPKEPEIKRQMSEPKEPEIKRQMSARNVGGGCLRDVLPALRVQNECGEMCDPDDLQDMTAAVGVLMVGFCFCFVSFCAFCFLGSR